MVAVTTNKTNMDKSKEIFNIIINGNDVNTYNQMPKEEKVNWIKKHTNQTDENLINKFVYGNNISERVQHKTSKTVSSANTRKNSGRNNISGQATESTED